MEPTTASASVNHHIGRYQCELDLKELVAAGKNKLILDLPNSIFTRLCKATNGCDEVIDNNDLLRMYVGKKRAPKTPKQDPIGKFVVTTKKTTTT